jgi:hypothetical protein
MRSKSPPSQLAEERRHSPCWFFLSFAGPDRFLGACIVRAHGIRTATDRAAALGIAPGGEVMATRLNRKDMRRIPAALRNRLLSEAEVRQHLDGKGVCE